MRSADDLKALLRCFDGAGYGAYRELEGAYEFGPAGKIRIAGAIRCRTDQPTDPMIDDFPTHPTNKTSEPRALPPGDRPHAVRPLRAALQDARGPAGRRRWLPGRGLLHADPRRRAGRLPGPHVRGPGAAGGRRPAHRERWLPGEEGRGDDDGGARPARAPADERPGAPGRGRQRRGALHRGPPGAGPQHRGGVVREDPAGAAAGPGGQGARLCRAGRRPRAAAHP